MKRKDGRKSHEQRDTKIITSYMPYADGSALIKNGNTHVICTATVEKNIPRWMRGSGRGWITAEYSMIPRSSQERIRRDRSGNINGRSQEIQRLIGRSIRSSVDLEKLGEQTIIIDCDDIRADGRTRTAAITGSFVALYEALKKMYDKGLISSIPVKEFVAAISVGIVNDNPILDLNYIEDSSAEVDLNVVMTETGKFIEIQGTGEGDTFSKKELDILIELSEKGINHLIKLQKDAILSID